MKQVEDDNEARRIADKEIADAAVEKHEAAKVAKAEAFADEVVASGAGAPAGYQKDATVTVEDKVDGQPWLGQVAVEDAPKRTALAINTALIQGFCEHGGIEAGQARRILAAIEAGTIDNISINY